MNQYIIIHRSLDESENLIRKYFSSIPRNSKNGMCIFYYHHYYILEVSSTSFSREDFKNVGNFISFKMSSTTGILFLLFPILETFSETLESVL